MKPNFPLSRAMLKISGEALMGDNPFGIDPAACSSLAREILPVLAAGAQLGVVVGGGNMFRGVASAAEGMDRAQADYIGMLGTIMNGMALADSFKTFGIDARVVSALPIDAVAERYGRARCREHMDRGRVPIFVAGTGNPFFTADTAGVLRAAEMEAQALLVGSRRRLGADSVESRMDAAAVALARDRALPVCLFHLAEAGSLGRALSGEEGCWLAGRSA